jgi:hypothetical protein
LSEPSNLRTDDVVEEARDRLRILLKHRGKADRGAFDMEPFEVLRDMIRQRMYRSVGGPPQLVRVCTDRSEPIAVRWEGAATLFGRRLLSYERVEAPLLDPDSLQFGPPPRPRERDAMRPKWPGRFR